MKQPTASPKLITLLIGTLMLTACQSMPAKSDNLAADNLAYSQIHHARTLFTDHADSPAVMNKKALMNALGTHLSSERYALSTYHHRVLPVNQAQGIDAGADSLWESVLKTIEHNQQSHLNSHQPQAFRSVSDYLYPNHQVQADDLGQLPYLRYDDEMAGRLPQQPITREVGMMYDDYEKNHTKLVEAVDYLISDIAEVSEELDELVRANPTITTNDKDVKNWLKQLNGIIKDFEQFEQTNQQTYAKFGDYLTADVRHAKQCAMMFEKSIKQVLSPNRQIKSYDGDDWDYYDLAYFNYRQCIRLNEVHEPLEPISYITHELKEQELKFYAQSKQCLVAHHQALQELFDGGKTYTHHPQAFAPIFIELINCNDNVITSVYDETYAPERATTLKEALDRYSDQFDTIQHYRYGNDDTDDESASRLTKVFHDYKKMKQAQALQEGSSPSITTMPNIFGSVFSTMIDYAKLTPEQLAAINLYQYDRTAMTVLSHHRPQARQTTMLYSLDYDSPTATQSVQLPVSLDFERSVMKADVAALLPIIAFMNPKNAPLPSELPNQEMTFGLPKDLHEQLPMAVIYDAAWQGIVNAVGEIDGEKFTAIDIAQDPFAKEVKAVRAIKVEFGSHEMGRVLGSVVKHIERALKSYIDANPDVYQGETGKKIKQTIADLTLINQGYHTQDVGDFWQVIEGILPIKLDQTNYFYLNAQGNIVGMQAMGRFASQIQNLNVQTVQQARYSSTPFHHPLTAQFTSSFHTQETFDGTAWLGKLKDDADLEVQAIKARLAYDEEVDTTIADIADIVGGKNNEPNNEQNNE